jgi:hypothetical protein
LKTARREESVTLKVLSLGGEEEEEREGVFLSKTHHNTREYLALPFFGLLAFPYSPNLDPMSSRKKVLLKVIILGDSG